MHGPDEFSPPAFQWAIFYRSMYTEFGEDIAFQTSDMLVHSKPERLKDDWSKINATFWIFSSRMRDCQSLPSPQSWEAICATFVENMCRSSALPMRFLFQISDIGLSLLLVSTSASNWTTVENRGQISHFLTP